MAKEVWFAVYLYSNGQWTRDRSFSADQRDQAIAAATGAPAATGALSAAVVEEVTGADTRDTDEDVVFTTPHLPGVPDLAAMVAKAQKRRQALRGRSYTAGSHGPKSRGASGTMVAAGLALCLLLPGVYVLAGFGGGDALASLGRQIVPVAALALVLVGVVIAARIALRRAVNAPAAGPRPQLEPRQPPVPPRSELRNEPAPVVAPTVAVPTAQAVPAATTPLPTKAGSSAPKATAATTAPVNSVAPELVQQQAAVVGLMSRCLGFLSITGSRFLRDGKIDSQAQLGHDLFLLGAAEAAAPLDATAEQRRELVSACLLAAARTVDRATELSRNLEGYLLEPRNLEVFRAGREAMTVSLQDDKVLAKAADGTLAANEEARWRGEQRTDIGMFLENSLDSWIAKAGAPNGILLGGGAVTVVVTGAPTGVRAPGIKGDETNQRVLASLHDRIIRSSLDGFGGQEIKSMPGDGTTGRTGMLIAFADPLQAIRSAVAMQRAAAFYSRANPDLPLGLAVGVALGRPVQGKDGLTGSPVPEAARLCGRAGAGQIVVSPLVRSQCPRDEVKYVDPPEGAGNIAFAIVAWTEESMGAVVPMPGGIATTTAPRGAGSAL